MKTILKILACLPLLVCCNKSHTENGQATLIVEASVDRDLPAIGYGYIHRCQINRVKKGRMNDEKIDLIVLGGNPIDTVFTKAAGKQQPLEFGFVQFRSHEKYSHAAINGFVDSNRKSWKMVYAQPAE